MGAEHAHLRFYGFPKFGGREIQHLAGRRLFYVGLIAYGHREKGHCADIELMVAPGAGTANWFTQVANAMQVLGKTPRVEPVRHAAAEQRCTEEKASVILITNGMQTCGAGPCAWGRELEAAGLDFTAHVVGFGLTAEEGKQVACRAENTGGQNIEAKDAGSLAYEPSPRAPMDFEGPSSSGHYGAATRIVPAGDDSIALRDGTASPQPPQR